MARSRAKARYEIGVIDRASKQLKEIQGKFESFDNVVGKITGTFAAVAGVAGIGAFMNKVTQAAVEIHDLNKTMGAGVEALSQYRHVASQSNVDFNLLTNSWQKMTIRISEAAKGTGEAEKVLNELGLNAEALARMKPEAQFEMIALAMEDVSNAGDRARIANKLFEESGVSLLKVIDQGAEGIERLRQEADDFGLTIDRDTAESMANFDSNMNKLKNAAFGFGTQLVMILGGPGADFLKWLTEKVPSAGKWFLQSIYAFQQGFYELVAAIREGDAAIFSFLSQITFGSWRDAMENQMRAALEGVTRAHLKAGEAAGKQADILAKTAPKVNFTAAEWKAAYTPALRDSTKADEEKVKSLGKVEKSLDVMDRALEMAMADEEKLEIEAAKRFLGILPPIKEATKETEKLDSVAQQLGFTFESSLEAAILKTGEFKDILKGLLEDIQKVIVRTAITEPFATAVSGIIKSKLPASMGGTTAGGTPGTPNQAGGVVVNINGPVSDASLVPLVRQAAQEGARMGYAMVRSDIQGGGPIRSMLR